LAIEIFKDSYHSLHHWSIKKFNDTGDIDNDSPTMTGNHMSCELIDTSRGRSRANDEVSIGEEDSSDIFLLPLNCGAWEVTGAKSSASTLKAINIKRNIARVRISPDGLTRWTAIAQQDS